MFFGKFIVSLIKIGRFQAEKWISYRQRFCNFKKNSFLFMGIIKKVNKL